MSNANRDYAIVYDVKNSSLVLSRPLNFYITDKNTSNIFVKLVTKVSVGNGIDQYTDIENASNYVLTMRVIKPNNEVKSLEATQHEPENIFQFDLTEDFKNIPGKYICELTISTIVSARQELITSDPFNYEVKRSILSNVGEIIETEDTTVEKLLNDLNTTKAELSSQIKDVENLMNKNILDYINVCSLGLDNTGVNDCSQILQETIDSLTDITLYFPSGKYRFNSAININNNVDFILNNSELIYDGNDSEYFFYIGEPSNSLYNMFNLRGHGSIDCKYKVNTAIIFDSVINSSIVDFIKIYNCKVGIQTRNTSLTGGWIKVDNLVIENKNAKEHLNFLNDSIGINDIGNDNYFSNISIIDFNTSILTKSSKFYNIHPWIATKELYDNSCFAIIDGDFSVFINCTMDTQRYGFKSTLSWFRCTILGFSVMNNTEVVGDDILNNKPIKIIVNSENEFYPVINGLNVELSCNFYLYSDKIPNKTKGAGQNEPQGIHYSAKMLNVPEQDRTTGILNTSSDWDSLANGIYKVDTYNGDSSGTGFLPVNAVGVLTVKRDYIATQPMIQQIFTSYDGSSMYVRCKMSPEDWTGWKNITLS